MTPATLDWLLELRNQHGAGVDAIALFRGAEPSAVIDAIRDCEIRILPVGAILLQPGQANDTTGRPLLHSLRVVRRSRSFKGSPRALLISNALTAYTKRYGLTSRSTVRRT